MNTQNEQAASTKQASNSEKYFWLVIPYERQVHYANWFGPLIQGKVVADLGCSWGSETLFLGAYWNPQRIIGIDNYAGNGGQPEHEDIFRENIKRAGVSNVDVMPGDAFNLPLEKHSVDVIMVSQAMHHFFDSPVDFRTVSDGEIEQMAQKLRHWRDVLKPGGFLLIRDTYRYCFMRYLGTIFPRFWGHVKYHQKQEPKAWIRILEAAGFRLKELRPYVPYRFRKLPRLASLRPINFFINTHYGMLFTA